MTPILALNCQNAPRESRFVQIQGLILEVVEYRISPNSRRTTGPTSANSNAPLLSRSIFSISLDACRPGTMRAPITNSTANTPKPIAIFSLSHLSSSILIQHTTHIANHRRRTNLTPHPLRAPTRSNQTKVVEFPCARLEIFRRHKKSVKRHLHNSPVTPRCEHLKEPL